MSSIKCTQCGLVNFNTNSHCKRCHQALNEFGGASPFQTNIQPVQAYQTQPLNQNQTARFQPYQSPPPPPVFQNNYAYQQQPYQQQAYQQQAFQQQAYQQPQMSCIKCGSMQNIFLQYFKKNYVPPAVYLSIFVGFLPFIILTLVLRVTHHINAPFCISCWQRFSRTNLIETLSTLGFLAGIIIGIIAAVILNTWIAFLFFFSLTAAFVVWGQIYIRKSSPKFKKINRQEAIIDAHSVGEIRYVKF